MYPPLYSVWVNSGFESNTANFGGFMQYGIL